MPRRRCGGTSIGPIVAAAAWLLCATVFASEASAQIRQNQDYCRRSGTLRLVLVDVTTPYDKTDKDAISLMIRQVMGASIEGDRLSVRTISDSYIKSERLIERCMPVCDAEGWGRLVNCNDGLLRIDRARARKDIVEALGERLATFNELKFSDIIRTINRVATEDMGAADKAELFIYSDLIENSDYLSERSFFYYSTGNLIGGLKKLTFIPNFRGAKVSVAGVGRSDHADRRPLTLKEMAKLTDFWKAYFKEGGAGDTYIGQSLPSQ